MGDSNQSPLAMLVLVTPYTILYLVNQRMPLRQVLPEKSQETRRKK